MIDDTNDTNEREERELDALIARYGRDYNRPPDIVPVEDMWSGIAAASTFAGRTVQAPQRSGWRPNTWGLIAASAAILAAGVMIGKGWESRTGTKGTPSVATTTELAPVRQAPTQVAPPVVTPSPSIIPEPPANQVASAQADRNQPGIVKSVRSLPQRASVTPSELRQSNGAAYQLATLKHFTDVETLLTSYSTSTHDAKSDAQLASWARDLLSQTRMLLDSPAATDPAGKKLLQDLEIVLVEMSQLSVDTAPVERDLIDGSVRESDVITRLRTAVPAGGAMHLKELD